MNQLDRNEILAFWRSRASITTDSSTRFHDAHLKYDLAALSAYCGIGTRLLEIGCGRCTMLNPLVADYGVIGHGVDVIPDFLDSAINHRNLTTEIADAVAYQPQAGYDIVLLAGLISCIPSELERFAMYERIATVLSSGAILFIKSQFGVDAEVSVNAWSEALHAHYTSYYPAIEDEVKLIDNWFDVQISDCYPLELNPHSNTKFFHLICQVKSG